MVPKVIFKEMSKEENIELIKWAYFENNGPLDVSYYTLEYYPELKEIDKNASQEEILKKIEEVVAKDYKEDIEKIKKEVIRYNIIWSSINDNS